MLFDRIENDLNDRLWSIWMFEKKCVNVKKKKRLWGWSYLNLMEQINVIKVSVKFDCKKCKIKIYS